MKLKKQQMIIAGVIIIALILVVSLVVILNPGTGDGSNNGAGNGDGTNGDGDGDGTGDGSTTGEINTLPGSWINLSDNIHSELGTLGYDVNFRDMYWIGDEGWITIGKSYIPSNPGEGELFHTTDGGQSFERYSTPYVFNCIHMLDSNEGYAGCQVARVYRTIDGGKTWELLLPPCGNPVYDMTFPPGSDIGYCCGMIGSVHRITSTGTEKMTTTWVSNMYSICFPTSDEGWVCGEDVIRHFVNDEWNADQSYPGGLSCLSIFMINDKTGWIVGGDSYSGGGAITYTEDGTTWKLQDNPFGLKYNSSWDMYLMITLVDVFFFDENEGWAVGNFGTILHTFDGGTTWTKEADGIVNDMTMVTKVFGVNKNCVYFICNDGTLLKYIGEE